MKLISDLQPNEAVRFGNEILVCLGNGRYEIDGSELVVHGHGDRQIMVSSLDEVYKIDYTKPELIGYEKDGKPFGSLEEQRELHKIKNCGDLVLEYEAYERLLEYGTATAVYSEREKTKTKVDIRMVGEYVDTGSEFIDTAISVGTTKFNGSGAFRVRISEIAKDEAIQIKKEYPDLEIATHSHLRYLKYRSKYVFNDPDEKILSWVRSSNIIIIYDSLVDAQKAEADIRRLVRNRVMMIIRPTLIETADKKTLHDIFEKLSNTQTLLWEVEPKAKSASKYHSAMKTLGDVRNMLPNIERT